MTVAIGITAAVLTTACWGPQLYRTLSRGTAEDFAWVYLAMLIGGVFGWMIYGILRHDPVIWAANALVTSSALVVVVVKLRSRRLVIEDVGLVVPVVADPLGDFETLVVGPKLTADLREVGITDAETVGAVEASRRLEEAGLGDDTSSGQAISGALSGARWRIRPPVGHQSDHDSLSAPEPGAVT
jgi:MtN3 and saliva related transmembrane protein